MVNTVKGCFYVVRKKRQGGDDLIESQVTSRPFRRRQQPSFVVSAVRRIDLAAGDSPI